MAAIVYKQLCGIKIKWSGFYLKKKLCINIHGWRLLRLWGLFDETLDNISGNRMLLLVITENIDQLLNSFDGNWRVQCSLLDVCKSTLVHKNTVQHSATGHGLSMLPDGNINGGLESVKPHLISCHSRLVMRGTNSPVQGSLMGCSETESKVQIKLCCYLLILQSGKSELTLP